MAALRTSADLPTSGTRARTRPAVVVAVVAAALLAVVAALVWPGVPGSGGRTLDTLRGRAEAGSSVRPYDSLDDLLANRLYRLQGRDERRPMTEVVVVGRFTAATAGRAYTAQESPSAVPTGFDDADVAWRTVYLTVEVEQVISGTPAGDGRTVEVGVVTGPDRSVGAVRRDLSGLGRVVLFLERSPVFGDDPAVYGIVGDGGLLGTVADDGTIALPVLDEDEAETLLARTPSVASLVTAAQRPGRLVTLDPSGASVVSDEPL